MKGRSMGQAGILWVDQDCAPGHVAFNRMVIDTLEGVTEVWGATSIEYGRRLGLDRLEALPGADQRSASLVSRAANIPRLVRFLRLRTGSAGRVRSVLFLGYDPFILPILVRLLPRRLPVLAFVHNQLRFDGGSLRETYTQSTGDRVTYLTLEDHIRRYLQDELHVPAVTIPHPFYRAGPVGRRRDLGAPSETPTVFAPSRSNSRDVLQRAAGLLDRDETMLCRAPEVFSRPNVTVQESFADFHACLERAHVVLVAASMERRVSGVAYEALAAGTRVVMPRCGFAEEIRRQYPGSVTFLEEVTSFSRLPAIPESEHVRFLQEHGKDAFGASLTKAVEI